MKNNTKKTICVFYICILFLFLIIYCSFFTYTSYLVIKKLKDTTSPVEGIKIDSLKQDNNKLILEVNNLDSIKYVKTIEVKNINNDSTLKLFYKLISK